MNDQDNILFTLTLSIQLISLAFLFIKDQRKALFVSNAVLLVGLMLGLISTSASTLFSFSDMSTESFFYNLIRIDGLGSYFLFIIQLIAIPTTIYNVSYLQHYIDENRSVKSFLTFYFTLLISMQLIVIANHSILFLVSWEIMSISAYLAMILEKEKEEVQKGSFYYFAASHVLIFVLYIMFFLLHQQTGSWFFSDYHLSFSGSAVIPIIFIFSIVGFGIKAGFIPFHFWLPQAHPVAPTVLSAFLSGVIIKAGIYGILRIYLFIKPVPEWTGWFILIISIISAIFGVWYALVQHDIKRLLAYHSIENIGIIGLGIGIGFIGSANNLPAVEVLGFGGALLHTLNHSIFKSLLFIGSGVVYQNLETRNIELMGGLVHRAKYIAVLFLIGSAAISGIPPFNGFISEFIIYSGFFKTANVLQSYYPILMLMFVVGLAFVGGLAVACFTKVNSIMFLGSERKEIKHFHTSVYDYISLGIFALLCIVIGFYPQPFIGIINKVIVNDFVPGHSSTALINIDWIYFTFIFSIIALGIIGLYMVKLRLEKRYGRRISAAWGCGYENVNPRMQYTASSFANELNEIPRSVLVYHKKVKVSDNAYPLKSKFESHSHDFVDTKIVLPSFQLLSAFVTKIKFLSQTDIRYYIGYILIIITIYSLIAILWS
ncbi:proton-conducting transporter membrane subunit [Ignavibacterium sp.]|jgi:hydrogenase-4 component B|uniref:proton-conducting transporter transmembrane domain-containing protein n=1 Tax=Ignavibacterium sp. TaxID=2651167 RepID=UPI0025C3DCCD|nr:proton-conducting transporter membrane subunit [Ignavibacterium sp.]